MILPLWFVSALLLVAMIAMVGNLVFLTVTLLREIKNKSIW